MQIREVASVIMFQIQQGLELIGTYTKAYYYILGRQVSSSDLEYAMSIKIKESPKITYTVPLLPHHSNIA